MGEEFTREGSSIVAFGLQISDYVAIPLNPQSEFRNPQLLRLGFAGHGNESYRYGRTTRYSGLVFLDENEILLAASHRYDHPPFQLELLDERLGNVLWRGSDDDRVKWSDLGPTEVPIACFSMDSPVA